MNSASAKVLLCKTLARRISGGSLTLAGRAGSLVLVGGDGDVELVELLLRDLAGARFPKRATPFWEP